MIGTRLPDGTDWSSSLLAGAYWRGVDGAWYALTPNNLFAGLAKHDVVEHDDRTITVSPSIETKAGARGYFHGFLERGVWRDC